MWYLSAQYFQYSHQCALPSFFPTSNWQPAPHIMTMPIATIRPRCLCADGELCLRRLATHPEPWPAGDREFELVCFWRHLMILLYNVVKEETFVLKRSLDAPYLSIQRQVVFRVKSQEKPKSTLGLPPAPHVCLYENRTSGTSIPLSRHSSNVSPPFGI